MRDMLSIPFSVAQTNEELKENILHFDMNKYVKAVDELLMEHGVLEDGRASQRVVDVIERL